MTAWIACGLAIAFTIACTALAWEMSADDLEDANHDLDPDDDWIEP